jgi:hypothetical protein
MSRFCDIIVRPLNKKAKRQGHKWVIFPSMLESENELENWGWPQERIFHALMWIISCRNSKYPRQTPMHYMDEVRLSVFVCIKQTLSKRWLYPSTCERLKNGKFHLLHAELKMYPGKSFEFYWMPSNSVVSTLLSIKFSILRNYPKDPQI